MEHLLQKTPAERAIVLLVEDDSLVGPAFARAIGVRFDVRLADSVKTALPLLEDPTLAVVVVDLGLPDTSGLELVRAVHERRRDVGVVVVSGTSNVDDAVRAMEQGAVRFLRKPCVPADLLAAVDIALETRDRQRRRDSLESLVAEQHMRDRADNDALSAALDAMWIAWQPIVDVRDGSIFAYEALLRSPTMSPVQMLASAERLGRCTDLGRRVRARIAADLTHLPEGLRAFVNLHAQDLDDSSLHDDGEALAPHAGRVVLEFTERARIEEREDVFERIAGLRHRGYQLAIDDLGAGYSALTMVVKLRPEFVKLDMSLVRDIDRDAAKRAAADAILGLCRRLEVGCVVEGVETEGEMSTLVDLGASLMQGYLFAKPAPPFVEVAVPKMETEASR